MVQYNVPRLAQEQSMCCWHTSAMMIWRYWQTKTRRQGPMNTLAPVYKANIGLPANPQAFITLAKTVGMKPLPNQGVYGPGKLGALLTTHGPLWCAGYWFGYGHVIVLTGIDSSNILSLNDPDGAVAQEGATSWFNAKVAKSIVGCLMCKDPGAY